VRVAEAEAKGLVLDRGKNAGQLCLQLLSAAVVADDMAGASRLLLLRELPCGADEFAPGAGVTELGLTRLHAECKVCYS